MSAADCDRLDAATDALLEAVPELIPDPALRQRIITTMDDFYQGGECPACARLDVVIERPPRIRQRYRLVPLYQAPTDPGRHETAREGE